MDVDWILVDGYSLLYRWRAEAPETATQSLTGQRQALLRLMEETAPALAPRVTVVFDGRGPRAEAEGSTPAVEVLFSPAHQTADTLIERLVSAQQEAARVLVVTSDRAERETTAAAGAQAMSCGIFLEHCQAIRRRIARPAASGGRRARGFDVGSVFPDRPPPGPSPEARGRDAQGG